MPSHPPYPRHRRALQGALHVATFGIIVWLAIPLLVLGSSILAQEELAGQITASPGGGLLSEGPVQPLVIDVHIGDDIQTLLARANESDWVVLNLPLGTLVLNTTLKIPMSVTFQGAAVTATSPGSVLSCGGRNMASLIDFSGSRLNLTRLNLQGCGCTGLHISSAENASVTILDSVFQNFTRALDPGRVNGLRPGAPASITPSTAALAIHAGDFSGNLTIRNSRFIFNAFYTVPHRRRLYGMRGVSFRPVHRRLLQTATPAAVLRPKAERHRRLLAAVGQSDAVGTWGMSPWGLLTVFGRSSSARARRLLDTQYSMPLLEHATLKHPGVQGGPWADDMETVLAVVCRRQSCSLTFENTTFENNTGVATGALYILCDGATACDVNLIDTVVTNNKLLWQQALQEAEAVATDSTPPSDDVTLYASSDEALQTPSPVETETNAATEEPSVAEVPSVEQPTQQTPAAATAVRDDAAAPQQDLGDAQPADGDSAAAEQQQSPLSTFEADLDAPASPSADACASFSASVIPGMLSDVPWITYTYPLVKALSEQASGAVFRDVASEAVNALAECGKVTGRTLGAVVLHQRGSPTPGVSPSAARAMVRVSVLGGSFSGNDGSAIMSTATDFMEMAGGNGTWSGGAPRHSADFNVSGLNVTDHVSGWPAIWLRWARRVEIRDCMVAKSSGAVWLDEVRDSVFVEASTFQGNAYTKPFLDYLGYAYLGAFPDGTPTMHMVKIQMTPLGAGVQNTATVRNCTFQGNAADATGVLYIRASDSPSIANPDEQPGWTEVLVMDSTFTENDCFRDVPEGDCMTGARALRISNAYNATVRLSRFLGNMNGGLACNSIYQGEVDGCEFDGNQLMYAADEADMGDNSVGGAGVYGEAIGSGGFDINASNFTRNVAAVGGGAVYVRFFESLGVAGSRFDANKALSFDGGAIWLEISAGDSTVRSSSFRANSAGRNGGAISASNLGTDKPNSKAWSIENCNFTGNAALLNISQRGSSVVDQLGGGAVFADGAALASSGSTWDANTVYGHAGGALRVVDSGLVSLTSCTFNNNAAIMGGAVALSRISQESLISDCYFGNNTVVDPRGWNATTGEGAPSLAFIDPGYGGALYAFYATVTLSSPIHIVSNSALFGGAIAIVSSPGFNVMGKVPAYLTLLTEIFTAPVAREVAASAGLNVLGAPMLPYRVLFSNNTALIGGAIYLFDTESTSFKLNLLQYLLKNGVPVQDNVTKQFLESPESLMFKNHPAILFVSNTANGGGAMYLEANGMIDLQNCRFAANKAMSPPLAANYTGLYGREKNYALAKALPCYNGGGGGICVVGQANKELKVVDSDMIRNVAKDGAGIYIAEGLDCIDQARCYNVTLSRVNMTGNNATSRGGGVFWLHEGIMNIQSCPTDKIYTFETNALSNASTAAAAAAAAAAGGSGTASGPRLNISLSVPVRKGPTSSQKQLTVANQDALLASVGGAVRTAHSPVYAVDGAVVTRADAVVYARRAAHGATVLASDGGTTAAAGACLTSEGDLVIPDLNDGNLTVVASLPVILNNSILADPSWYGVPYIYLPCANWDNMAGTGPDVSSTPYFVLSSSRLDFYTSNTDIKVNVTVHDWLGHNCTGSNDTQPLVLVYADSPEVSGAVTVPAVDGVAEFTALRLRAKEGLHHVNMTARAHGPLRELLASQMQIYVRPCAINEFLSPKNLDECVPCDVGSYNFNASAVVCMPCPDNAKCWYPDPTACKLGAGCDPLGFLVPQDGYWHANFFSEEVIECTNSDACTAPNRSARLSQIQLAIWKAAREIQLSASNAVADVAAKEFMAQLISFSRRRGWRRQLQEKAISDDLEALLILNATADMLPDYMRNQCAPGYTGNLCGECMPGYGWRGVATCGKCPTRVLNNLYYAFVTLLTLSLLAFTVYSSLKEQRRPGLLVGGLTTTTAVAANNTNDKAKPGGGKTIKINSVLHGGLCVQASGPSQFHVILAAAAAEDAAAEAAPALALLREQQRSNIDLSQFPSAPCTPRGARQPALATVYDAAGRAHSVLGVPVRVSHWANLAETRRAVGSFTQPGHRSGSAGGAGGIGGASGTFNAAAAAGVGVHSSCAPDGSATAAGPLAEGLISGFDNALFESPVDGGRSGRIASTDITPLEEEVAVTGAVTEASEVVVEVEEFGVATRTSPSLALNSASGSRPVAEAKDYTNALYEEPEPAPLIHPASGAGVHGLGAPAASTGSNNGRSSNKINNNQLNNNDTTSSSNQQHQGQDAADTVGSERGGICPMPQSVMLQPVPLMQSNSPPRTPLHGSITSAPPGALELPTVAERVCIGEMPRRGKVVGRERAHQSTLVKIFVSYVQVLALLQNVPLEIPGVVDVYYRINNQAISYPGILVSLDCSLPHTSVSKAFVRIILTVLAPLYIFAGAALFFLVFNMVDYYIITPYYTKHPTKKSRKRHLQLPSFGMHLAVYLGRQLIVTFIAIFFFFYPSVVQSLMAIFNCQDVNVQSTGNPLATSLGLERERIWSQDYGHICYKGSHLALTLGLGMPGVLLIAIGWPLMSALFMTGKLTFMNNIRFTEDMTSFFLADFKAKFAWWESVIMLRKLFIAVIVTLVDGSTYAGVQLLLVICILVVAAAIHIMAMPYHHMYTNNLELMSLATLLGTLYFSLYFGFSTSITDGGRVAISILILVINILMVLVFTYYIAQAYFYAALVSTGLGDLDSEARRKLTAAELQQRILDNLTQVSNPSFNQDGQQHPGAGERQRTSYHRVASIYATAMWYSMRMSSTTNKVVTRVKTLLRDPHGSRPVSREGSISSVEAAGGFGTLDGRDSASPAGTAHSRNSPDGDADPDDPEAARGSGASPKCTVSDLGSAPAAALSDSTSLPKSLAKGQDKGVGNCSRGRSQNSPGIAVAAPLARNSNGGQRDGDAIVNEATSSPRAAPQVVSRSPSEGALGQPRLPPDPMESDPAIAMALAAAPLPPQSAPLPPAAVAVLQVPAIMCTRPNAMRSQSRLAHASSQADRSEEMLPPPPNFPGRDLVTP